MAGQQSHRHGRPDPAIGYPHQNTNDAMPVSNHPMGRLDPATTAPAQGVARNCIACVSAARSVALTLPDSNCCAPA
jgi:hypothetical protein